MKNSKHLLLALALFISSAFAAFAQLQTPAASPAAFVSQNVGFTKISIDYSSPAVKGRKIFGSPGEQEQMPKPLLILVLR
jgi:hypothetical protein